MEILKRFWLLAIGLLSDNRGFAGESDDDDDDNGGGTGDDNPDDTGGEGGGGDQGGEGGTGDEDADNLDEETLNMFGGDKEMALQFKGDPSMAIKSYKELMGKHKPTEMENAAIKDWAGKMGLKANYDASGNFTGFSMDETKKPAGRQKRFTEEHAKNFDRFFNIKDAPEAGKNFRELISAYMQDLIDDAIEEREKTAVTYARFREAEMETEEFIKKVYPDADPESKDFPEGGTPLYNRATEIYKANKDYQNHPKGQLFAVHEAAIELGIQPQAISQARRAGREEGAQGKRILSRIGAGGAGGGEGRRTFKKGEISMEEFMGMSPSDRRKYQEAQFKKQQGG